MGRRKRDGNHSTPKNNVIQDSEGNEENGYPVPDSNKTKINDAKEPNDTHKNFHKEEILKVITEKLMEMLLHIANKMVQEVLLKFQDIKNEEYKRYRNR
jgi:hypothetical protein